jgi:HAD superfamily hydrolase (TIGR01509 family)
MTDAPSLDLAAIAFDLGNVLVKVDHWRFCRRLALKAQKKPEEIFRQVFETDLEPGYDTGRLTSQEFYRRITGRFHLALPYPEFCGMWSEIFDPMDGMEEILARLAARYPLYLVSNTNPLHFHYIQERFAGVLRHIRSFILSYQVGSRKPEPGFYQALIRATGQPPQHCLFIDDKALFVEAARRHGLMAWQFTTPEEFQRSLEKCGI